MVRQMARTLTVVAGNDDVDEVNWDAVAQLGGTVVLLTGRAALPRVVAALRSGGMPPDTPVAAISAASRPHQRTVRGTLAQPPSARRASTGAPLTPRVPAQSCSSIAAGPAADSPSNRQAESASSTSGRSCW